MNRPKRTGIDDLGQLQPLENEHAQAVSPAESRSAPDRPLAGVRPVKAFAGLVIATSLPQAKLGNLRRCGSASAIAAWAILLTTASIPTPIRECARRKNAWFGCASFGGGLHTITRRTVVQRPDAASTRSTASESGHAYIRLKLYWNWAIK